MPLAPYERYRPWYRHGQRYQQRIDDAWQLNVSLKQPDTAKEAAPFPTTGQATPQQALELLEEGVPVLPLALPKGSKQTLQ